MIKYRLDTLEDAVGNDFPITVLQQLIVTKTAPNFYIFVGDRRTGITEIATTFLQELSPNIPINITHNIEILATNNILMYNDIGTMVDWDSIIKYHETYTGNNYCVIITNTITDIPEYILSRIMLFKFNTVQTAEIEKALNIACAAAGYTNHAQVCSYIASNCNGYIITAFTMLNQYLTANGNNFVCLSQLLGTFSYEAQFELLTSLYVDHDTIKLSALKQQYPTAAITASILKLCLNIKNYRTFNSMLVCDIPSIYEQYIKNVPLDDSTLTTIIRKLSCGTPLDIIGQLT